MSTKQVSRRRLLQQVAVTGGVSLLHGTSVASEGGTVPPYRPTPTDMKKAAQRQTEYDALVRQPVYKASVEPHWFGPGDRYCWYRNDLAAGKREFILVDAVAGARKPAFDATKLVAAIRVATGKTYPADTLPFDAVTFNETASTVSFAIGSDTLLCDLSSYVCAKTPIPRMESKPETSEDETASQPMTSPDKRWTAYRRGDNIWVRSATGTETQLSQTGTAARPFRELSWSPSSKAIAAFRITHGDIKKVYAVESSPKEGWRGVLHETVYDQPGDVLPSCELWLLDPEAGTAKPAQVDVIDFNAVPDIHWRGNSDRFVFERTDRGHQRFRLIEVDAKTGVAHNIIDEKTTTFINTSNAYTHFTEDGDSVIYASERNGWRHLYWYDLVSGSLKNQITQGEWVVRDVDYVDEKAKQIWFRASGRNAGEDPYHLHTYRVNFDGSGLIALTEGNGTHTVRLSPTRTYLVDSYSRADAAPVHNLRRSVDGTLVCELERTDISALQQKGWRSPEVFQSKGRDGVTDIWGIVFRPSSFDPARRYPIIENIYAGPHDSFTRKSFAVRDAMQSLAELGFIVVQCDGMGTRNRSKAFHDVCWHNVKDAGLPDRIAWIKALAKKYPYCDTDRVGIYGTSAGGQSSTGALLFHPDFYKVAVSSCGCHDNRIDKRWWNEQWMGYPVGPHYNDNSNITHATNLRGKLLLMVGELDTNVPPESTLKLADALIQAGKDFDLLVLPGMNHTSGGQYGERRRRDYFVRHLLGIEPPDRNAPVPAVPPIALIAHRSSDDYLARGEAGESTTILFVNQTKTEAALFWLSGDGKRIPYGTVAAGATRSMHTYAGHAWLVVSNAQPVAIFVGDPHPGIATIGESIPRD